jgi:hypothetical protein
MYALALFAVLISNTQNPVTQHIPTQHKKSYPADSPTSKAFPANATQSPAEQQHPSTNSGNNQQNPENAIYRVEVLPQAPERWFKLYVAFTGAIAFLNVGILWIMWLQRRVMLGQIKEMQEARKHDKEIAKLEYRAWIQIEAVNCNFTETGILVPLVSIENTGRTPAKNVKVWFVTEKTRDMAPPNFNYTDDQSVDAKPILPPKFPLQLGAEKRRFGVRRENWSELENRTISIFVHGKIAYEDVFGEQHWMTFCFMYEPSIKKFAVYDRHNETDD